MYRYLILLPLLTFPPIHSSAPNRSVKPSVESLSFEVQKLLSHPKPYKGKCHVEFHVQDKQLDTQIYTDRLIGHYITESDIQDIVDLYGSEKVMEKYCKGSPYPKEHALKRAYGWIEAKKTNNPWTALKFVDEKTGDFVLVFMEPDYLNSEIKESLEITVLTPEKSWKKGYSKEALSAVIRGYIPEVISHDYKIEGNPVRFVHLHAKHNANSIIRLAVDSGMFLESVAEGVINPKTGDEWGDHYFFVRPL